MFTLPKIRPEYLLRFVVSGIVADAVVLILAVVVFTNEVVGMLFDAALAFAVVVPGK